MKQQKESGESNSKSHDHAALASVLEMRDSYRQHPIHTDPCHWLTELTWRLGKVASQADQMHFDSPVEDRLRQALINLAGATLAWIDNLEQPLSPSQAGYLFHVLENSEFEPPAKVRADKQKAKQADTNHE